MKQYVSKIQPGNKALDFIDFRIDDVKYRGNVSSEHNRYDINEIHKILVLLDKYAPNKALLRIRDTDCKKRPENTDDEIHYAHFCENVKASVGKGSQDSIRKNIFVDLHRMGLIDRYNQKQEVISPYARQSAKYVSLTDEGIKFINQNNVLNRAFLFTKAINNLLKGYIDISLNVLGNNFNIDYISKPEFMFFVSAVDSDTKFSIDITKCAELITAYRRLSLTQRKSVIEILKKELVPSKFKGDKTQKRDWHNWKNKIDQIYHLFKQSPYFDIVEDKLSLSTHKIKTKSGELIDVMKRSISEKEAYFANHKIARAFGFELHHVVPLSWAENPEQYKLFDKWENMVYIDAYRHAMITQNRNRNIVMSSRGNDIILSDYRGNSVELSYEGKNILYKPSNQQIMLDYNKDLRETV